MDGDAELVHLARSEPCGDAARALFERHQQAVFSLLVHLIEDSDVARELLQETFVRAFQSLPRFDAERPLRPWLQRIARNAAFDHLRRQRTRQRALTPAPEEPPGVVETAIRNEDRARAREAFRALDPEEQALLAQRYAQGMKQEEIAASWGCTERTVRNRLRAAVDRLLRNLMQPRCKEALP